MKKSIEKLFNQIRDDKGEYISNFVDSDYRKYIVTGLHNGTLDTFIGKVFQVRKEHGAFGTDTVLIACLNHLQSHENQSFWYVKDKYIEQLDKIFPDLSHWNQETEFDCAGTRKFKGFIVPSPFKKNHVSPIKALEFVIKEIIAERLSQ